MSVISLSSGSSGSQGFDRGSNAPNEQNFLEVVLHPDGYLTTDHMEKFIEILLESTEFLVQDPVLVSIPHTIERRELGVPNLQILFAGAGKSYAEIGHWICVHYDGSRLHVYDSFNSTKLHPRCETYIRRMYGDNYQRHTQTIFHKVQRQTNVYDCGIFAIANATSVALGLDPVMLKYEIPLMRSHVAAMLTEKILSPFVLADRPVQIQER